MPFSVTKNQKGDLDLSRCNRRSSRTPQSSYREVQLNVPRDCNGVLESRFIPKYQCDIPGTKEKVSKIMNKTLP